MATLLVSCGLKTPFILPSPRDAMPCMDAKSIDRVAQSRRYPAGGNRVHPLPITPLNASRRVPLEIGAMRLNSLDWGTVLMLQLSLAVDPEICVQLCACKYAIVHDRITTWPAVRIARRRPKPRDAMKSAAQFESRRRPAMEV